MLRHPISLKVTETQSEDLGPDSLCLAAGTSTEHRRKASFSNMFSNPLRSKESKSGGFRRFARSLWLDTSLVVTHEPSEQESRGRSRVRSREDYEDGSKQIFDDSHWSDEPALPRRKMNKSKSYNQLKNVNFNQSNRMIKVRKLTHSTNHNRALILKNFSVNTSTDSIISQITCGPLEKLNYRHHPANPTLEIHFVLSEGARKFYNYCTTTGFVVVDGKRLEVEWANESNTEDTTGSMGVPKYLFNEIVHGSARRVLICLKIVPHKPLNHLSLTDFPNPELHLSKDFDIDLIKHDFSKYGEIVEFGAVISRKLCFSIHFTDIRSAILAKTDLENKDSMMNAKYHDWFFWYGKDPTDKPCYHL